MPLTISWKEEGRFRGERRLLVLFGSGSLGEPSVEVREAIDGIDSVEAIEQMAQRLPSVTSWDELLAGF